MTDISARRRWSARLLIGAAAVALPLTGSISYAQSEPTPPAPPTPPAAPSAVEAPLPPAPPEPPEAPSVTVSDDGKVRIVRIERRDGDARDGEERRIERHVIVHPGGRLSAEDRARFEKHRAEARKVRRHVVIRDGKVIRDGHEMSAEERAEFEKEMKDLRKELREHDVELRRELERELGEHSEFQKEMREKFGANSKFQREMQRAAADARAGALAVARVNAPRVTVTCRDGQRDVAETVTAEDGSQTIFVCNSLALVEARKAIVEARADIAAARADVRGARGMAERERAEALRSLDIAERELRTD